MSRLIAFPGGDLRAARSVDLAGVTPKCWSSRVLGIHSGLHGGAEIQATIEIPADSARHIARVSDPELSN